MSKRFVSWGIPARERTQEEIDLDRRLDEQARRVAASVVGRDDWARAQYRASSRAGKTREWFEANFRHADMQIMDAHVDQMFWQMVRHEMRTNPRFVKQMEFIASFYEMPQHEFLEKLKKRHWAQMQMMTDDRQHSAFLMEVWRAWHAAQLQIEPHPYQARAEKHAASERAYLQSADHLREQYRWRHREDPMQALFDAIDEEDLDE